MSHPARYRDTPHDVRSSSSDSLDERENPNPRPRSDRDPSSKGRSPKPPSAEDSAGQNVSADDSAAEDLSGRSLSARPDNENFWRRDAFKPGVVRTRTVLEWVADNLCVRPLTPAEAPSAT